MNGKIFRFRFNRATGRALAATGDIVSANPFTFRVVSASSTGFPGSANEALKLWTTTKVAS